MLLTAPAWRQDLLLLHIEKLETLWRQRRRAWSSSEWTQTTLRRHDARILAHADALVLAADEATLLLEKALSSEEEPAALGAAHVFLSREDDDGIRAAHEIFATARGPIFDVFRVALRHAPIAPHRELLIGVAREADRPRAVAALSALAFHAVETDYTALARLVQSSDVAVRGQAWEAVAFLGRSGLAAPGATRLRCSLPDCFRAQLSDPDASARDALLAAAAWTGAPWLFAHLRGRAAAQVKFSPCDLTWLRLFAALSGPEDVSILRSVAAQPSLGPERIELLGANESSGALEDLLAALDEGEEDPELAMAAARAFRDLTGIELPRRSAWIQRAEGGDDGPETMEEVQLPDPGSAYTWRSDRAASRVEIPAPAMQTRAAQWTAALRQGDRLADLERLGNA